MNGHPYNLVPKDKFDTSNIDKLRGLSDDEIRLIIPELLKWTQDMNWPVANEIVDILIDRGGILEPYILEILSQNQNDDIWTYWIISVLIPKLTDKPSQKIISEIKRIAENPTNSELCEEVNTAAINTLRKLSD